MDLVKPPALKAGDTFAAVSLSAGVSAAAPHRHAAGRRQLAETFGLEVVDAPHALADDAFLRASPQARADDLHWALREDGIAGIVSTIGGDDSIRTVPFLDLDLIRAEPKVFIGFSDTTVQHLAHRAAGVVSFYGPSLLAGFGENGGVHPYVEAAFRQAVFQTEPYELSASTEWTDEHIDWRDPALASRRRRWWPNPGWQWLQGGAVAEGELIGGNFETLEMAKGTSIWPRDEEWNGAVLAVETSEEAPPPTTVGYWLQNYAATGVLHRIGALLISRPEYYTQADMFRLWDIVERVLAENGLPDLVVVANLDYGHSSPMGVLPLGCRTRVDPIARAITVLESGVR